MNDLMAFLGGAAGGVICLIAERFFIRWRAQRTAKKQLKVGSEAQFLALLREAKKQGISLPPEAKDLIREADDK